MEYEVDDGLWDPVSGGALAVLGTLGSCVMGIAGFPNEILKALNTKTVKNPKQESHKQEVPSQEQLLIRFSSPLH